MRPPLIAGSYYNASDGALTITYRDDEGAFRYFGVTPEEYAEFREAPSQDAYVNYVLRDDHHPWVHLEASQTIHLVPRPAQPPVSQEMVKHGEDNRRRYR